MSSTTAEALGRFFIAPTIGGILILLLSPLLLFLTVKAYASLGHSTYIKQVGSGSVRFFVRTRESAGFQLGKVIGFLICLALWPLVTVYGILIIIYSRYDIWNIDIFSKLPFENPNAT
jgi:hypothetical protein